MFTYLIAWSLHNRLLSLALALVICLFGGYALKRMYIDVFPEFAPPQVVIQTEAPGFSPLDVESLITYPIETAINGTPGVMHVRSKTNVGLSTIIVVFDDKTDIYRDRQLINERIQQVSNRLPVGSKPPIIFPITSAVGSLVKYALVSKTVSPETLRTISDWEIRPRILSLGGIAFVVSIGGEVKQYQVLLDPTRMLAYHITANEIRQALQESNMNVPGAFLQRGGQEFIVGALGRVKTLQDLRNTIVTFRNNIPITVTRLAEVRFGGEIKRGDGAYNLDKAVVGTIYKSYGADTLTTTYKVEKTLAEIKKQLPPGVALHTQVFRQANFIESAIKNLNIALLESGIIVVIILFIFLANWRASLITFLAIPISFVGGIVILYLLGIGINAMTLGGLAIAIGEVVDNAIITVENSMRRLRLNRLATKPLPAIEIIFDAVLEIQSSVVYATIIICLVFVPIFFLQGIAQRIFTPLAIAYIASVFASLMISITLLPALCYFLLVRPQEKKGDAKVVLHPLSAKAIPTAVPLIPKSEEAKSEKETSVVLWLKRRFVKLLGGSLRQWWWVVGTATVSLLLALSLIPFFGRTFLPEFHEGNFIIIMVTMPGTSLPESMRIGELVRKDLLKYPQVVSISQRAGRSELDEDGMPPNYSEFDVHLNYKNGNGLRADKLIAKIRHDLTEIPGATFNVGQFIAHRMDEVLTGFRAQVTVKIFGEDLPTLNQLGQKTAAILRTIPGAVDIYQEQQINVPQIIIRIDREKAARYGINVGGIAQTIQMYLNGETVSSVLEGRRNFALFVRLANKGRNDLAAIQDMLIDAPNINSRGKAKIPLRAAANVSVVDQPYLINRENVQRLSVVSFNVQGRDLGSVVDELQKKLSKQLQLPKDYFVTYGGQFESQKQATRTLMSFGAVILLAALMLLYKVFGSFREAFLVMLNIPFALIGGIISLFIAGADLSVAAAIGFITLFGITLRNGIILVAHYHQLSQTGKILGKVVIQGALDRLAPVLMTAATAALGLIPLLWGSPVGKELERPLAQVLLGGLITSTALNLVMVPTLYYHLEKWRQQRSQNKKMHSPS